MNILLWVLQVVLAFHTVTGAYWKFSHTAAQTMPALGVIPQPVWLLMSVVEIAISFVLVAPALNKRFTRFVPFAAGAIVAEMLLFCALYLASGNTDFGPLMYWLVVAAISFIVAYGRMRKQPVKHA